MVNQRVTRGELEEYADENGIDAEGKDYEELRDEIDIKVCGYCRNDFLYGWTEKFCSDTCEVHYINEYY